MKRMVGYCMAAAVVLSGCGATTPNIQVDSAVPLRKDSSMLVITSPQQKYMPAAGINMWINYDYFLDCTDDRCKIGTMHPLQYIDIPISSGEHTLYVRMAPDGVAATTAIINTDTVSTKFTASNNSRQFIAHDWELSLGSFIPLVAAPSSTLKLLEESAGAEKLQTVIDTKSIFGTKMAGYGERGTTYDKQ